MFSFQNSKLCQLKHFGALLIYGIGLIYYHSELMQEKKNRPRINTLDDQQLLKYTNSPKKSYSLRKINSKLFRNPTYGSSRVSTQGIAQDRATQKLLNYGKNKLSPLKNKQYETKLKISGESWMIYDYEQNSYKRGWKPNDLQQFSGMIRVVLLKAFIELKKENQNIQDFQMVVDKIYLKEQIQKRRIDNLPLKKKKKMGIVHKEPILRGIESDSMISMVDIMYGLFMTDFDDIIEYAIIFMGYLSYCVSESIEPISEDMPYHFIEQVTQAKAYADYLAQYLNQTLFPVKLGLTEVTKFNPNTYYLSSSCNDMCKIFQSLQKEELFKNMIGCRKQYTCRIKFKVGFKYWQNRVLVWKNCRVKHVVKGKIQSRQQSPKKNINRIEQSISRKVIKGDNGKVIYSEADYFCILNWRNSQTKNYSVLCKNMSLNCLIIIADCKFGMCESDIEKVQAWMEGVKKHIVEFRADRESNMQNSAKILPRITRNHSQASQKDEMMSKILKMKGIKGQIKRNRAKI